MDVEKDGYGSSHVSSCCHGHREKHKELHWEFV